MAPPDRDEPAGRRTTPPDRETPPLRIAGLGRRGAVGRATGLRVEGMSRATGRVDLGARGRSVGLVVKGRNVGLAVVLPLRRASGRSSDRRVVRSRRSSTDTGLRWTPAEPERVVGRVTGRVGRRVALEASRAAGRRTAARPLALSPDERVARCTPGRSSRGDRSSTGRSVARMGRPPLAVTGLDRVEASGRRGTADRPSRPRSATRSMACGRRAPRSMKPLASTSERPSRGTARRNLANVSAGRRQALRPSERVSVSSTPRSMARRPRPRSTPLTE